MSSGLTKKQVIETLNTSFSWVEELLTKGALTYIPGGKPRHRLVDPESLSQLVEGQHYVVCRLCGGRLGQINHIHTRSCSGVELQEYVTRFPDASVMSTLATELRAKTPDQRAAQSLKLKARFQTPEGETTRQQISDASRVMQAGEYGERAAQHLREMNTDPIQRAKRGAETRARWDSGTARSQVEGWHREHRDESLASAANARRHIQRKRTKLHLGFKVLMESNGLTGFITEHEVGYHAIDEARPDLKIAAEVDGCYWHSCPQCGLKGPRGTLRTDKAKTAYLTNLGWTVIRIWEHDINRDPMACLERIRQHIADKERENHAG